MRGAGVSVWVATFTEDCPDKGRKAQDLGFKDWTTFREVFWMTSSIETVQADGVERRSKHKGNCHCG